MVTSNSPIFGATYAPLSGNNPYKKFLARQLGRKRSFFDTTELMKELTGVVAGATASVSYGRVQHSTTELGGKRTIETVEIINRATTSADKTDIQDEILTYSSQPSSYPVDKAKVV